MSAPAQSASPPSTADQRRARIMAVATAHFLKSGFERANLDRVAADARVGKQAIYEFFRNKYDLFDAVVRAAMIAATPPAPSFAGEIETVLENQALYASTVYADPHVIELLRANIVAVRRFPELATALHEFRRQQVMALADYLSGLAAAGRIGPLPGPPLDHATRLVNLTLAGTCYLLGRPLPEDAERMAQARFAVNLFLKGIGAADAGSPGICRPAPPCTAPAAEKPVQRRMSGERYDVLCDAALDEFMAAGFENASVERIHWAAKVSRTTIYRQFCSKEGLFRRVVEREIARQAIRLPVPDEGDLETRLVALARSMLDLHLVPRALKLHRLLIEEALVFPELAQGYYDARVARLGSALAQVMAAAGHPRPSPGIVAAFHTLATFGMRYVAADRPVGEEERAENARQCARILTRGLRA